VLARDDCSAAPPVEPHSVSAVQPDDSARGAPAQIALADASVAPALVAERDDSAGAERHCVPVVQPDDSARGAPAQIAPADALVVPALAAEQDDPAAPQQARLDARSQEVDCPADSWADLPAPQAGPDAPHSAEEPDVPRWVWPSGPEEPPSPSDAPPRPRPDAASAFLFSPRVVRDAQPEPAAVSQKALAVAAEFSWRPLAGSRPLPEARPHGPPSQL
jgi:hypothetical protein